AGPQRAVFRNVIARATWDSSPSLKQKNLPLTDERVCPVGGEPHFPRTDCSKERNVSPILRRPRRTTRHIPGISFIWNNMREGFDVGLVQPSNTWPSGRNRITAIPQGTRLWRSSGPAGASLRTSMKHGLVGLVLIRKVDGLVLARREID